MKMRGGTYVLEALGKNTYTSELSVAAIVIPC